MIQNLSGAELPRAAAEVLQQGECLLACVGDDTYTTRVPAAFNATMGGHLRHCLDHFRSLLGAVDRSELDYDRRERGTLVETDRFAALNEIRALREAYQTLGGDCVERVLAVSCKTSYASGGSQCGLSTFGRELMYCVAHAVHHYALIGVMAHLMDVPLPPGFGVAPSTLKHQATSPAALAR